MAASWLPEPLVVLLLLVATNVWVHLGPRHFHVVTGPLVALALVVLGRGAGLSWAQLGLDRRALPRGLALGAAVSVVLAAVYVVALALPAFRGAFLDSRYDVPLRLVLREALVAVPLGTVAVEEIAFRGVLWGLVERDHGSAVAVVVTSALFGVWHVLPALAVRRTSTMIRASGGGTAKTVAMVLAMVIGTATAGVVLAACRWWTGSLAAPVVLHWTANGLAVLAANRAWAMRAAG